jgi:hypothetical protein
MNRPDHEVAAKEVVKYLNQGVERLDSGTRERLAAARKIAMSRYREQPAPVWGLAWAMNAIGPHGGQRPHGGRYLVAVATLVLVLIGFGYWQTMTMTGNDFSDVDVSLLTDELPINAYLDNGFDSWLKRASR